MATALTLLLLAIPINGLLSRAIVPRDRNRSSNLPTNCWPNSPFDRVFSRELTGTQTGRSRHCRLELCIEHTKKVITALWLRPSTLSLGHNKDRQRRNQGSSDGLEGRAAWMKNGELEFIVLRRAVFERLCSATLKQ